MDNTDHHSYSVGRMETPDIKVQGLTVTQARMMFLVITGSPIDIDPRDGKITRSSNHYQGWQIIRECCN